MKRQILIFLFSAGLLAGEISGSYSGAMALQRPDGERKVTFSIVIKQTPEKLTVTCGPSADEQHATSNVKLEGDNLSFDLTPPGAEGAPVKFNFKVEDDRLSGTMVMNRNGDSRTSKVDLKKQ